ncbi:MAG: hypothetical protein Hyperionvirus2_49 [Hyperionvirus sp.]|uniref:Uncharacterized protein n=1 Tax=Hyperionvirus sp. TaxID=2487770 RepID=A0A3G5A925_9VIRU|nr:MAG: hypothetical protein Hyperionvirus2_49 [Hyperionvirus sp.]
MAAAAGFDEFKRGGGLLRELNMVNLLSIFFDKSGSFGEADIKGGRKAAEVAGASLMEGLRNFGITAVSREARNLKRFEAGIKLVNLLARPVSDDSKGDDSKIFVNIALFDDAPHEELSARFEAVNPVSGLPVAAGRKRVIVPEDDGPMRVGEVYKEESIEPTMKWHESTRDNPNACQYLTYVDKETKIDTKDYVIPKCFQGSIKDRLLGSQQLFDDIQARSGGWRGGGMTDLRAIAAHATINAATYPCLNFEGEERKINIRDILLFITDDEETVNPDKNLRNLLRLHRPYARNIVPIVIVVKITAAKTATHSFAEEADFKYVIDSEDQIDSVADKIKGTLKIIETWVKPREIKNTFKEEALLLTRQNGTTLYVPPMSTICLFGPADEVFRETKVARSEVCDEALGFSPTPKAVIARSFTAAATTAASAPQVAADRADTATTLLKAAKKTKRYNLRATVVPPAAV